MIQARSSNIQSAKDPNRPKPSAEYVNGLVDRMVNAVPHSTDDVSAAEELFMGCRLMVISTRFGGGKGGAFDFSMAVTHAIDALDGFESYNPNDEHVTNPLPGETPAQTEYRKTGRWLRACTRTRA